MSGAPGRSSARWLVPLVILLAFTLMVAEGVVGVLEVVVLLMVAVVLLVCRTAFARRRITAGG